MYILTFHKYVTDKVKLKLMYKEKLYAAKYVGYLWKTINSSYY